MKIIQKRIQNVQNYLGGVDKNTKFYVGLINLENFKSKVRISGFQDPQVGECLLPTVVGPVSKFNAEGGAIIHRDKPKETVYREIELTDWHGNQHYVDVPYQRYPRTSLPPPSIELAIAEGHNSNFIVVAPLLTNNEKNVGSIKHVINLFLELYGECDILSQDLLPTFKTEVKRLNWSVLPPGNYPWAVLRNSVKQIISNTPSARKNLVQKRIEDISNYNPDFVAIGVGGFYGYIIFGFSAKNLFVLESSKFGNATYILGQNWEFIARMTKAEILQQNLHLHRVIHGQKWLGKIAGIMNPK